MYFEVYASAAVRPFSKADLIELLDRSREKNTRLGLTGMLLYKDGNFMQMVEGEETVTRTPIARIERDPRHTGFLRLISGRTELRQFPDWSMAFRDLGLADDHTPEGYNAFLNTPLTGAEFKNDPSRAQRLLLTFKRTM